MISWRPADGVYPVHRLIHRVFNGPKLFNALEAGGGNTQHRDDVRHFASRAGSRAGAVSAARRSCP